MRRGRASSMPLRHGRQGGFALIAALILLAVLGTTGAVMLRMTAVAQSESSRSVLGERGKWAARSGIEWANAAARAVEGCPGASTTLDLDEGALAGYRVFVTCAETRHIEDDTEYVTLTLASRATRGALATDFVLRDQALTLAFATSTPVPPPPE